MTRNSSFRTEDFIGKTLNITIVDGVITKVEAPNKIVLGRLEEIEITPQMIEAGLQVVLLHGVLVSQNMDEDQAAEFAIEVYQAMTDQALSKRSR